MISIIIACYNAENTISILFDSLIKSNFKDFELCICNDASTDITGEVIDQYKNKFKIKITTNKTNRGIPYSRNQALKLARNDLLLFLDADIRLYKDTINKLLGTKRHYGAAVIQGIYSSRALDPGLFSDYYANFINHSFLSVSQKDHYTDNVFNAWCALCSRSAIKDAGGFSKIGKKVEIENEILGRSITGLGYQIITLKDIYVDHHWGGHNKFLHIFTNRVYWWVKIFFYYGRRFEKALTNKSYAISTACFTLSFFSFLLGFLFNNYFFVIAILLFVLFILGYYPFYVFLYQKWGAKCLIGVILSAYFSVYIFFSAAYSFIEEIIRIIFFRKLTLRLIMEGEKD